MSSVPGHRIIKGPLSIGPGDLLAERYAIEDELGVGGMGTVFRAVDRQTGERLAIKGLNQPGPDLLVRFKREYRALADVRHPNLVRLGELFEARGRVFFTMELIEGVGLREWVWPGTDGRRRRRDDDSAVEFDEARLRSAMRQLADGLTALHAADLVHRDVKPSNILVDASGRVVLLDFGLATRIRDGLQQSDVLAAGTVAYMAPEQAAGRPVGPRADWYAFGVLLFEAMTGSVPFDGPGISIATAKLTEDPPDPATLIPGLPRDLATLCHQLLTREPRQRPSAAEITRRLAVSATSDPPPRAPLVAASFVGRREELGDLATALTAARRGPVIQLVVGESGLGKTTLVKELTRAAAERGALVLDGRCHQRETLPFKAFDGIADTLSRRLRRFTADDVEAVLPRRAELLGALFPAFDQVKTIGAAAASATRSLTGLDPREARRRAFTAFRELLGRLAQRQELILVIDDLHRADPDSVDLLGHVMRPDEGPAALLIATARPSPMVDLLIEMGQRDELVAPRVMQLGPLGEAPARELARLAAGGGGPIGARDRDLPVAAIVDESRGHPGFILELTRAAAHASHVRSLEDLIMSRVDRLAAHQQATLDIVAVAEAPLPVRVLDAAAGPEHGRIAAVVEALCDADLLVTSGHRGTDLVEPCHDRIADTVRDRMPDARRQRAHAALARALEATGGSDPERILSHYLAADESEPVLRLATLAAELAAAAMEHRRAARLCNLALSHAPPAAKAEHLHLMAATALAAIASGADAADHFLRAATLASARGDATASREGRRRAADQLLASGDINRAVEILDRVLRELGVPMALSSGGASARLLWSRFRLALRGRAISDRDRPRSPHESARLDTLWSAATALSTVDAIAASACLAQFLHLALNSGDCSLIARGLALEACYLAARGGTSHAQIAASLAEAERIAAGREAGSIALSRATASLLIGDFASAAAAADAATELREPGDETSAWRLRNARLYAIRARWWAGRLPEFAAMVRETVAVAREHRDLYSLVQLLVGVGGYAWLIADDLPGLQANIEEATRTWHAPTYQQQDHYLTMSIATAHIYAGRGDLAWAYVTEGWLRYARSPQPRLEFSAIDAWQLRGRSATAAAAIAATAADRDRLLADAERCARRLARKGTRFALAYAGILRAAAAAQRGQVEIAEAQLDQAAAVFVEAGMPVFAAAARWNLATLRPGAEARRTGDEIAAQLGAMGVAAPARFATMLVPGIVTTESASR